MPSRTRKEPDGWSVRESLDGDTGQRTTAYYYKRNRAPRIQLKGKLVQQLAGYTLIEKDLRSVLSWLGEIEVQFPMDELRGEAQISGDRKRFNIVKGLYVASLTFYGKCFTSCEGRNVKLEKRILDTEFVEAHDQVMHMRHNFAAHSGSDNFEEAKIALVLHPKRHVKHVPKLYREITQADFLDGSPDEVHFRQLAEHVKEKVWEKIRKVERAIYETEIFPKGPDYWYKQWRG